MKRFIDLRGQSTCYNFAWFDTITDTFEEHGGDQCWETWEEFEESYEGDELKRYRGLSPEWTLYDPT